MRREFEPLVYCCELRTVLDSEVQQLVNSLEFEFLTYIRAVGFDRNTDLPPPGFVGIQMLSI